MITFFTSRLSFSRNKFVKSRRLNECERVSWVREGDELFHQWKFRHRRRVCQCCHRLAKTQNSLILFIVFIYYRAMSNVVMHCKSWETEMNGRVKKINDKVATPRLAGSERRMFKCSITAKAIKHFYYIRRRAELTWKVCWKHSNENLTKAWWWRWISCACWYFLVLRKRKT